MGNQVQRRKSVVVVLRSRNILILARIKIVSLWFFLLYLKFEVLFYQLVHLVMG